MGRTAQKQPQCWVHLVVYMGGNTYMTGCIQGSQRTTGLGNLWDEMRRGENWVVRIATLQEIVGKKRANRTAVWDSLQ